MSAKPKSNPPAFTLTTRSAFDNLSPTDRFKLLEQREFDGIGFERLYRGAVEEKNREVAALKSRIKQLEQGLEREVGISNQQSREIWGLAKDLKVLQRQLTDLGHPPLR